MPEITLEAIEAKHTEVSQLIEQFKRQPKPTTITHAGVHLSLRPGERYAGAVLKDDGSIDYHLIKLPDTPPETQSHSAQVEWAKSVGGKLANKREMRLIQANLQDTLPTSGWCWLEEENGSSCAWCCYFYYGDIYYYYRSSEGAAVAVRRVNP